MIYSLTGKVSLVKSGFVVVEVAGIGFRVICPKTILGQIKEGDVLTLFTHFQVKEDKMELYGFLSQDELSVFDFLNLVNGVGPKSAMAIMNVARPKDILAAIKSGKADLLAQAVGIGKRLAERVVLELKNRVGNDDSFSSIAGLEMNVELTDILLGLGYKREQIRSVISKLEVSLGLEEKVKAALKILSGKGR